MILGGTSTGQEGMPSGEELLRRYSEKRQNPKISFEIMQQRIWLYVAFQAFKLAIIMQGIAARKAKGQASSAQAEVVGGFAPEIDKLGAIAVEEYLKLKAKSSSL